MSALLLKNVSKVYPGDQQAIKDLSLEIKDREFLILAGPTGCGKSTLLRMIAGLEEVTSGTVFIDGIDMTDTEPKDRNLAMLFKNNVLYQGMNVYDNLVFALRIGKIQQTEIDRRVKETAELLELEPLLERMPEELSEEENYRVLIGRAVIREPGLLLLDSTMARMEHKLQTRVCRELKNLCEKMGLTVIYVTDNQEVAKALGTRILVMNDGAVCQAGTPDEIFDHPCCQMVAGFWEPSMNLIPAVVFEEGGRVGLQFEGGQVFLPDEAGEALREGEYPGKEVVMGIRPDALLLSKDSVTTDGSLTAVIGETESAGEKTLLKFQTGDTECAAFAVSNTNLTAGEQVVFAMAGNKVHVFDKDTEKAVIK